MGVEANGTNKAFSTSFPTLLAESFIRAVLGGMAEVERSSRRGEHDGGRDVSPLKWTHSSSQLLSTFPGGTWINCSGRFVNELFYFPCVIITLNTVEMRWYTLAVDCISGLWVMSLFLGYMLSVLPSLLHSQRSFSCLHPFQLSILTHLLPVVSMLRILCTFPAHHYCIGVGGDNIEP